MKSTDCRINLETGELTGENVLISQRTIGDLSGIFEDEPARQQLPQDRIVYNVFVHQPIAQGTPGGLFFGTSYIHPGLVGNEFFMTKGHYHENRDTAEYYWCIQGTGLLVLMDLKRKTWTEKLENGSLHYIPGNVAHRLVNTGNEILTVGACWYANAGHDYDTIQKNGFAVRVKKIADEIKLISTS